jgi:single-strand DNA-binding protein
MNSVVLIGRLTKDPELRYIPESQNAVATFTLAVDRAFSKEKQADFIKITVFGKQAENCERFLTKGKLCGVQGRIQTGSYKNKEGAMVYTTDVVADRVEFLEWGDKAEKSGIPSGFEEMTGFAALDDLDDNPF